MSALLVLNAGSSSIKFTLFSKQASYLSAASAGIGTCLIGGVIKDLSQSAQDHLQASVKINQVGDHLSLADIQAKADQNCDLGQNHHQSLLGLIAWIEAEFSDITIEAVGHRVVHGGDHFVDPVMINDAILAELKELCPLAPLHQPHNLDAIDIIHQQHPNLPQIACFDTAFHHTHSRLEQSFALPAHFYEEGIKRYGFHGLSYDYISQKLQADYGDIAQGRVIIAHLGNGSSLCGIRDGKSVTSTMGFTAVEGLMMGTRCGHLDPGLIPYLMEYKGYDIASMTKLLYKESGLLGVSGISSNMQTLLESSEPAAQEAVDLYIHRLVKAIGEACFTLEGLDAIVFTAGIGEHAAPIREKVISRLSWLGAKLDMAANRADQEILSTADSQVKILCLPTNEEAVVAQASRALLIK